MGLWANFLTSIGLQRRKVSILILGLDNSGKTTLISHFLHPPGGSLDQQDAPIIMPTVGLSLERFAFGNLALTVFDMSGQGRYREFWEYYYGDADGIMWVLDSTDTDRIGVVHEELWRTLSHKDMQVTKPPILFFANKIDLPGCMTGEECSAALRLDTIRDRNWNIIPASAINGDGLTKGLEWLAAEINAR
ncbi:hypothetical protein HKX48_002682 [Thoreauomyces humboldtii]|nr:hypothetical protein HKX48_002682 [Thoreauomyces humboldtii]